MLAQYRLMQLGDVTPDSIADLDPLKPVPIPELTDDVPEDDPHVVKARLLANAGLNEYIEPVSYTHLDVYKRQPLRQSPVNPLWTLLPGFK